eukprot:g834.t1
MDSTAASRAHALARQCVGGGRTHVLVTGGCGFIGSHTVIELLEAGYTVTVIDNLVNSNVESMARVGKITGLGAFLRFERVDLCDAAALQRVFRSACASSFGKVEACVHFAALKAVGESVRMPLDYYANNLTGTFNLLRVLQAHDCHRLVFSSSATVYGSAPVPYSEGSPTGSGVGSPYGQTKCMIEQVLRDVADPRASTSETCWHMALLRYFNPVGAHPSGLLGEDPSGTPNNLMPYIARVCVGRLKELTIFGKDYPTADGTCERDYIHVVDLAKGHVAALRHLEGKAKADAPRSPSCEAFNLGSGQPTSVLQMVRAMEQACGKPVPFKFGDRRAGDLPSFFADPAQALEVLQWRTEKGVDEMCADTWRWQSQNPDGLNSAAGDVREA